MRSENVRAVVTLSGGQDSATALALAVRRHGPRGVAAVTFRYGQRHALEIEFARAIAKRFGVREHKIVDAGFYGSITSSALLDPSGRISRRRGASCPTTVVEGRNAFFLLAAAVRAKALGAKEIWTGVSEADSSGYPDCRLSFIRAQQRALRLAMEWPFRIVAPFIRMTKAEEWALADELGIFELVRDGTLTCYRGVPGAGCGRCPACRLRNRGLKDYLSSKKKKGPRC